MSFALLGVVGYLVPKGLWIPILLILIRYGGTLKTATAEEVKALLKQNVIFLAVPCYALLSVLWAVEPAEATKAALKVLGYVVLAILVVFVLRRATEQEKRSILIWSAIGLIATPVIVWVDIALEGGLLSFARSDEPFIASSYNRGATIAVCALLPVTVGLFRYALKPLAMALVATTVVTVFILESESAKLALIAGGVAYFLVYRYGRLFWPTLIVLAGIVIAMPAIFSVQISDKTICTICEYKCSAAHRLIIYNYSSLRIFEKPVIGWGMNSARSIPSGKEMAFVADCVIGTRADGRLQIGNRMPLHPHNAALQAWLELGFIGVFLIVGTLATMLLALSRRPSFDQNRSLVAGVSTVLFFVFNISFGFWQGWLLLSMVLLCGLMSLTTRLAPADGSPRTKTP